MGEDHIRHLLTKRLVNGETADYWNPSKTLLVLRMNPEALGTNPQRARARAVELNNLGDELRRGSKHGSNGDLPGSFSRLARDYQHSLEFGELKPRTRKDYAYCAAEQKPIKKSGRRSHNVRMPQRTP
jgi:hypothetical protein